MGCYPLKSVLRHSKKMNIFHVSRDFSLLFILVTLPAGDRQTQKRLKLPLQFPLSGLGVDEVSSLPIGLISLTAS